MLLTLFRKFSTIAITLVLIGCSPKAAPPIAGVWFNHDRRSSGTVIDDQAICIKASLAIAKDKKIWKNSHISTLSYNNSLLLVGQASSQGTRNKIKQLLADIPEINHIYDQLTISTPISLTQRAKDTWLTTQVKAKIISNQNIGPNRVKVITENNIVYLMGKLTKDEGKIAAKLASTVKGVTEVVKIFESIESAES